MYAISHHKIDEFVSSCTCVPAAVEANPDYVSDDGDVTVKLDVIWCVLVCSCLTRLVDKIQDNLQKRALPRAVLVLPGPSLGPRTISGALPAEVEIELRALDRAKETKKAPVQKDPKLCEVVVSPVDGDVRRRTLRTRAGFFLLMLSHGQFPVL